jgi:hypothetical protein
MWVSLYYSFSGSGGNSPKRCSAWRISSFRVIQVQQRHGGATDGCVSNEMVAIPPKVRRPGICSWIEQWRLENCFGIKSVHAVGFMQIAGRAAPSQIIEI